jgi:hypothetical protein
MEVQMLRNVIADLTEIAALATFVGFIAILA